MATGLIIAAPTVFAIETLWHRNLIALGLALYMGSLLFK